MTDDIVDDFGDPGHATASVSLMSASSSEKNCFFLLTLLRLLAIVAIRNTNVNTEKSHLNEWSVSLIIFAHALRIMAVVIARA